MTFGMMLGSSRNLEPNRVQPKHTQTTHFVVDLNDHSDVPKDVPRSMFPRQELYSSNTSFLALCLPTPRVRMEYHFFDNAQTLVRSPQHGLVRCHPPNLKDVCNVDAVIDVLHDPNTLSRVHDGGNGLLAATVTGDTLRAVVRVNVMVLYSYGQLVTTYTPNNFWPFGLATQEARADGNTNMGILLVGDGVSVCHIQSVLVGRRVLASTVLGTSTQLPYHAPSS
ncbi:hypothetical protein FPV67DRAFT_1672383 [Lyophyllum atratum]|nr:hypothetical protein FPV67DRAFT_1672383 [Lyophyllum atratum]